MHKTHKMLRLREIKLFMHLSFIIFFHEYCLVLFDRELQSSLSIENTPFGLRHDFWRENFARQITKYSSRYCSFNDFFVLLSANSSKATTLTCARKSKLQEFWRVNIGA